jgi:PEGA domain
MEVVMKKLFVGFFTVGAVLQVAVADRPADKMIHPVGSDRPFDRDTFQADYDLVWQTVLRVLSDYQFQFSLKDKPSGRIQTGYLILSRHPQFSKLTTGVKAFGKTPKLFLKKWQDGRIKVHVEVKGLPANSAQVIIQPQIQGFASTRLDDTAVTGEWHDCKSNGKFEFELFNEIATQLKRATEEPPSPPLPASSSSTALENAKNKQKETIRFSNLLVQSAPEGAEIYLDDKLVGMTPSRISLAAGQYKVVLRKQGFKEYQREFVILQNSDLTVSTELDQE